MEQTLKKAGYIIAVYAFTFALYSCNNNKTTTSSSESDSAATVTQSNNTAASPDSSTASSSNTNSNADANFVIDVAKANSQEMQMLEAGEQQGNNKKLKADAKKMLADHRKLAKQIVDYASKKNITLSSDTTMDMSAMNSENEAAFDTAWTQKMIDGHKEMISKFETAQNTVTDPELKTMITNTLPTLHAHLEMVQSLMASLKK